MPRYFDFQSIPVAVGSKARVCSSLLAVTVGSNPVGAWMSLVSVV
jgi:hypothetical protein